MNGRAKLDVPDHCLDVNVCRRERQARRTLNKHQPSIMVRQSQNQTVYDRWALTATFTSLPGWLEGFIKHRNSILGPPTEQRGALKDR
jgi:hypothetical protein